MKTLASIENKNTDDQSPERIWIYQKVDEMWFNHNDQHIENTIDKTVEFLKKAQKIAQQKNFVDVVVKPTYIESDECSLDQNYLVVEGWREETKEEYKKRLERLIGHEKHRKKMWEMDRNYFEKKIDLFGSHSEQRVAEWDAALKKI